MTFDGEGATVEDIRLTSTWLRSPADGRIIVPNELLAGGILRNDSIGGTTVALQVQLWLAADVDPIAALDRVRSALPDVRVSVAETSPDGVRLVLLGGETAAVDRAPREAQLREAALRAVRAEVGP